MRWWISDTLYALALTFALVGWATALSLGPVPTLIAWALAASGFLVAPTRPRAAVLIAIVLLPFFYFLALPILLIALISQVRQSLARPTHLA